MVAIDISNVRSCWVLEYLSCRSLILKGIGNPERCAYSDRLWRVVLASMVGSVSFHYHTVVHAPLFWINEVGIATDFAGGVNNVSIRGGR